MHSPLIQTYVRYLTDAAVIGWFATLVFALSRRPQNLQLVSRASAAMIAFHLLLDLLYWRRFPIGSIHFAIQFSAFCLVAIRGWRPLARKATTNP